MQDLKRNVSWVINNMLELLNFAKTLKEKQANLEKAIEEEFANLAKALEENINNCMIELTKKDRDLDQKITSEK